VDLWAAGSGINFSVRVGKRGRRIEKKGEGQRKERE
jgi:hypothetical protein